MGGRWFLGAAVALGVAAIFSGNNVIYLLESLLLSALLFSGVLSEATLSRLRVERVLKQARAGEAASDLLHLTNDSWLPLYCVEVGEWGNEETELAFVLLIPARARITVGVSQAFAERGAHRWRGLTLATSFPFGFARKTRFVAGEGRRLVWPAERVTDTTPGRDGAHGRRDWEPALGELEEVPAGEDMGRVHWPSFARTGKFLRRPPRPRGEAPEVRFRAQPRGPDFERRVSEASFAVREAGATLLIEENGSLRRYHGSASANDALAQLPREGE